MSSVDWPRLRQAATDLHPDRAPASAAAAGEAPSSSRRHQQAGWAALKRAWPWLRWALWLPTTAVVSTWVYFQNPALGGRGIGLGFVMLTVAVYWWIVIPEGNRDRS